MSTVASVQSQYKTDFVGKDLSRGKFYGQDFSHQDLRHVNMRSSLFHRCNFDFANMSEGMADGADFAYSTFRGTNCYRLHAVDAKLTGVVWEPSDCMGMAISFTCDTFQSMKISQNWFFAFLLFACMMEPAKGPVPVDLKADLIAVIGAERYVRLRSLFQKRVL